MTVIIKQVEQSDREYFAYTPSLCGKATYFIYFTDDILGAIALVNFVEMLRSYFKVPTVEVKLSENSIKPKNQLFLQLLRQQ